MSLLSHKNGRREGGRERDRGSVAYEGDPHAEVVVGESVIVIKKLLQLQVCGVSVCRVWACTSSEGAAFGAQ